MSTTTVQPSRPDARSSRNRSILDDPKRRRCHNLSAFDGSVATIPGRGWDMTMTDFPTVTWASSLSFLAPWSDTAFRAVGQAYTGASPVYIAVSARRRAGRSLDGGDEHGEFKFSMPVQVSVRDAAHVDEKLLAGLDAANAANSLT